MCKEAGIWPTSEIISGFLTPSRRIHHQVEPLLAPLWNYWQASWGARLLWSLQGMSPPRRLILLEVSVCHAQYRSSLLIHSAKGLFLPLAPLQILPLYPPFSSLCQSIFCSLDPHHYPLKSHKIPVKFPHHPFFPGFPLHLPIVPFLGPQIAFKLD